MTLIKNYWTYILGAAVGALGGYLYWMYIGCSTGTCPITSSATLSTIYGTVLGSLIGGMGKGKEK